MNIEQMTGNEDLYEEILNLRRLLTLAMRHVEEEKYGYALATLDTAVAACGRLAGSDAHQILKSTTRIQWERKGANGRQLSFDV